MAKNQVANITLNDCRIIFRNFSGKEGKFNPAGRRSFCVILDNALAADLEREGWNIKYLKPRDDEEEPQAYLQVRVNYGNVDPKIYMVVGKQKTLLDEDSVSSLDYAEIENVDLVIRPYEWDVNGKSGITAYVKTMYVTVARDEFADKYDFSDEEIPF
jgi:hypothetical protein